MREKEMTLLRELVDAPSPSGFEGPARAVWRRAVEGSATIRTDILGNTIAAVNPEGTPRVLIAGHIDEIGFMVTYIADEGFIYFGAIGGHDPVIAPGQRVHIHTSTGVLLGVIGRRATHLSKGEKNDEVRLQDLWIDTGIRGRDEVVDRVQIGDPITLAVGLELLAEGRLVSRALDNKIGALVVAETVKGVAARSPEAALFGVATVQEEIGLRGAFTSTFSVNPHIGIAVDVTHAVDHPGGDSDKRQQGDIRLGKGPVISRGPSVNPVVFQRLIEAAKEADVPYQIEPLPGSSGTDGDAIQRTQDGVATGIVSIPIRYMHTPVEMLEIQDVDHTITLLTTFVTRLDQGIDLTP